MMRKFKKNGVIIQKIDGEISEGKKIQKWHGIIYVGNNKIGKFNNKIVKEIQKQMQGNPKNGVFKGKVGKLFEKWRKNLSKNCLENSIQRENLKMPEKFNRKLAEI